MAFEDVAVLLSRAEWDALTAEQRELYQDVLSDTYELLTSLGYPGPKPDVLHRLERGEEPWISSSPGHTESWLEEPSSDWWPRASGYQGLETSCPGWSTLWCLQDRNFQKFGCHKGRSRAPLEAASGVGSQIKPWPVKEEVEDKPELMEDITHREIFLLHSMMEQQSLHPREQLWNGPGQRSHRNAQNHGHTLGEAMLLPGTWGLRVEELRELEGCTEGQKLQEVSLQNVFRNVLKAVRYILDSICEKLEFQGVPQGKSIWPIIIQIDNLTEKKKKL
nr:zinc finger protein 354A-like [Zonotrichia albicollis]